LTGQDEVPIASLVVGDAARCMLLARRLYEAGVRTRAAGRAPGRIDHRCEVALFITVQHTEAQFHATIPVLARELERLGSA
jgi:7-keto-8-aminopelargonate synthetase-like enzyme